MTARQGGSPCHGRPPGGRNPPGPPNPVGMNPLLLPSSWAATDSVRVLMKVSSSGGRPNIPPGGPNPPPSLACGRYSVAFPKFLTTFSGSEFLQESIFQMVLREFFEQLRYVAPISGVASNRSVRRCAAVRCVRLRSIFCSRSQIGERAIEVPRDEMDFACLGMQVHVVVVPQAEEAVGVGYECRCCQEPQVVVHFQVRPDLLDEGRSSALSTSLANAIIRFASSPVASRLGA